jgi:adenylate cyclase
MNRACLVVSMRWAQSHLGGILERKLAAILAADVVGYSRLIGADETGTLDLLRGLLKDVVEPTIARHHGRVAIGLFDQVNDLDPGFAPAFAMASDARVRLYLFFSGDDGLLNLAAEKARIGIALDAYDPICHLADARANSFLGRHDIAIGRAEEAVGLNPSASMTHHALGFVLARAGRAGDGIPHFEQAIQLGPRDIFLPGYLGFGSFMLFDLERYEDALNWARRGCNSVNPRPTTFAVVVACLVQLNRDEDVAAAFGDMTARSSIKSVQTLEELLKRIAPFQAETVARFVDALRKAGLPE